MNLNKQELQVLLASLNNLTKYDEQVLSEEYTSVSSLYNKLYTEWELCNSQKVS